jgi:hypothetical protein
MDDDEYTEVAEWSDGDVCLLSSDGYLFRANCTALSSQRYDLSLLSRPRSAADPSAQS